MVRRISTITMMTAALLISTAHADEPLSGSMEARKVVPQKSGRELLVPATEVHPEDVIEYRLTYANNSEGALKNVSVIDPIPTGTEYVSLSATRPRAGTVEFSIDSGKTYHVWPVHYKKTLEDGTEVVAQATPQMVSHIRWTIAGAFEPESEITLSYRATVK